MTKVEAEPKREGSWRAAVLAAAAGGAAYALSHVAARSPDLVERAWGAVVGPTLSGLLSRITGVVPFAVGELLLLTYAVFLMVIAAAALFAVLRRERRWTGVLAGGTRRVVRDAGVLVFLFYLLWGLNYARPPLEQRMGWPAWQGNDTAELIALSERAVAETNEAYLALHGKPDAGQATAMPADSRALEAALDEGWARATATLGLPASLGGRHGRVKRPLAGPVLARFGIGGVYMPFTAEANVVRDLPAMDMPHTMAHEKAHQRGVASEAEAGFLGFLAGALAPDPLCRYASAMHAHLWLLAELRSAAPEERQRIAAMRLPGVQRDLQAAAEYYNRFRGVARTVGTAVNNSYLRANRIPGGVRDYRRSTRLLVAYARANRGVLFPAWGGDVSTSSAGNAMGQ
jgi:hypothetical protein